MNRTHQVAVIAAPEPLVGGSMVPIPEDIQPSSTAEHMHFQVPINRHGATVFMKTDHGHSNDIALRKGPWAASSVGKVVADAPASSPLAKAAFQEKQPADDGQEFLQTLARLDAKAEKMAAAHTQQHKSTQHTFRKPKLAVSNHAAIQDAGEGAFLPEGLLDLDQPQEEAVSPVDIDADAVVPELDLLLSADSLGLSPKKALAEVDAVEREAKKMDPPNAMRKAARDLAKEATIERLMAAGSGMTKPKPIPWVREATPPWQRKHVTQPAGSAAKPAGSAEMFLMAEGSGLPWLPEATPPWQKKHVTQPAGSGSLLQEQTDGSMRKPYTYSQAAKRNFAAKAAKAAKKAARQESSRPVPETDLFLSTHSDPPAFTYEKASTVVPEASHPTDLVGTDAKDAARVKSGAGQIMPYSSLFVAIVCLGLSQVVS